MGWRGVGGGVGNDARFVGRRGWGFARFTFFFSSLLLESHGNRRCRVGGAEEILRWVDGIRRVLAFCQ